MNSTTRALVLVWVCCTQAFIPSLAAADQFFVNSTRHDAETSQLVIAGGGFQPDMQVALNGTVLRLESVRSHEIRATMPTLLPGTYRLSSSVAAVSHSDSW